MKSKLPPSQNVEDTRRDQLPLAPSKNPFSYAQDRTEVNTASGGYNGPTMQPLIKDNPFQSMIDAIQTQGDEAHQRLKSIIGDTIGQLNRIDENGYNIRSRARAGALRPNTRSNGGS